MKKIMGHATKSLIILLGWNLLCYDATVTVSLINSANGDETLECGSDGIVSCRINPYVDTINWVINGTPYATCAPGCSENPNFPGNYYPTYDVANGVFNLTVDSATLNDSSTTFICDDGSLSDDITIEVIPAYSENKTGIKDTDKGKQVEFTTACVQPGVEFEWFTIKSDNSNRKQFDNGHIETTETTVCSLDPNCAELGTDKVTSVIMIPKPPEKTSGNREEERYIEVAVLYKNPDKNRTFRFDEIFVFEVPYCEIHCGFILSLIYFLRWVLLLALSVALSPKDTFLEERITKCLVVVFGNIPIFDHFRTAFPLCHILKELGCCFCVFFIIFCICDIGVFVVVICTCNGNIEVPCYWYTAYAFAIFLLPWMNYGVLAKWLNKKPALCGKCAKQTKQKEKNKCNRCCEFICEDCRNDHINDHVAKDENCRCFRSRNKSELYCLRCKQYLCKWCKPIHALHGINRHSQQETNETQIPCNLCDKNDLKDAKYYSSDYRKFVCEDCQSQRGLKDIIAIDDYYFHSENNVESYCLSCHQYVCTLCFTKHADDNILRHSQQEAGKKRCEIFCNMCKKDANKKKGKYCKIGDKSFVCEDCKSKKDLKDIVAIDDYFFHSENNVESYCLKCKQYLCTICYSKHAKHRRILRHFQHETGKKRCHIFCKLCLKLDERAEAKYMYHNEGDRIFVCEDCQSGKDPKCIIAIDEMELEQLDKDLKCKEGCKENPVECYCMIEDKNMCAACFKEIRTRSEMLKKWTETETRQTEQDKLCALHSVAGLPSNKNAPLKQNAANESQTDVLCLVCNEYLCKMCFKQHLEIKQLWRKQHHAEELLDKQTSRLTILHP